MKLKAKFEDEDIKLGEVVDAVFMTDEKIVLDIVDKGLTIIYNSISEFRKQWEDAPEEPKEWWSIDQFGEPINVSGLNALQLEKLRRIGNLFRTEKETEKAVEKLKAWERLKDDGIRFTDWSCDFKHNEMIEVDVYRPNDVNVYMDGGQLRKDLDLLFGGEE